MPDQTFIQTLNESLPAGRVLTDPASLSTYEQDGLTSVRGRPAVVVIPETTEEVVSIVRICHEYSVPFVARGSGTSLSGGATPVDDGVVIALNRLNRIICLDPDAMLCTVQPGVLNLQVSQAAARHGLHFAPDPSSGTICTIGGNVAFNAGGAHCLKYGMTANHVTGMKIVLPDGELVEVGAPSRESTAPGLPGLFCGSEGLFGIAVEITLRLLPLIESHDTFLVAYPSLESAGRAVAAIIAAGLLPGAMEIMDRLAMDAVEAAVSPGYPPEAAAMLIVELEGTAEETRAERSRLLPLLSQSGAISHRIAESAADRALIWKGRKSAFSAAGRLSSEYLVQDGVVPRSRLGDALARIAELSQEYGLRVANVFHAGDGNLHPLIMFDSNKGEAERAEQLAGAILRMCIGMGGSITGEHGVGLEKRAYLEEQYPGVSYQAMLGLAESFDPKAIANPGKKLLRTVP